MPLSLFGCNVAPFLSWLWTQCVTVFTSPDSCLCRRTAPRPCDEASADRMVSKFGSKSARTGLTVKASLIQWKELCCGPPHTHMLSFTRSSRMGCVNSARCGENLLNWLTISKNRCTSPTHVGLLNCTIAVTLSRSGRIPSASITCPKNLTEGCANEHFSAFSVMPREVRRSSIFLSRSSCSLRVAPI